MTFTIAVTLLLQLLGTVIIAHAWSQNVHRRAYQPGWFGPNCQFKCHCKTSTCYADGMCADGVCKKGWFGPGCQYVDLVYVNSTEQTLSWLKDDTCNNDQTLQAVTVNLTSEFPFTWLRLQVMDPLLLRKFQVTFSGTGLKHIGGCTNMRSATVNERTMDVHCDLDVTVQTVTLTGEGVKSLCSLYISGGRNVALRQSTSQSSTYSQEKSIKPSSEKAVDGNVSGTWADNSCTHTDNEDKNPTWNVTFSQEQKINRYVLYNRDDLNKRRLQKFTLTSFTKTDEIVFKHTDSETGPHVVYTISSLTKTFPITLVKIQADNKRSATDLFLTLCEVELYGDSACPPSKYGRGCQYTCNCAVKNETCFVSTGGCPSGCSPGFQGESCNQPCDLGKYGEGCNFHCSHFCIMTNTSESPCHHIDGTCQHGCKNGYQSAKCDHIVMDDNSFSVTVAVPLIILALVITATIGSIYWFRNLTSKTVTELESTGEEVNSYDNDHEIFEEFEQSISGNRCVHAQNPPVKLVAKAKQTARSLVTHNASNDYVYNNCNSRVSSNSIAIGYISSFMASHDKTFFQQQFNTIPANTDATMATGTSAENKHKNRYKNICAYDHSRVLLKINKEKNHGNYINASYIEGYKGQQKFIASQGPTQATLEDFVRMLSEQSVEVVVMLTNLTEDGKIKCERYWPEHSEMQTGDIKVKLTTTQVFADYTIRRLQLLQEGEPSQTVTQFHFTSWPDKDVPTTAWSLVDFEQRVASISTDKPIVVHCSAGVGRTGTFIALHNVLREATDNGHIDFFITVQKLRHDRAFMVQTLDQYIFLHRAAQIAIVCMETTVSASNITERIKSLEKTSKLGQSNLKLEFKAICSLCDDRAADKDETNIEQISSTYENSQTLSNKLKNRFQNILAKEDYRVILTGDSDEGSGDYINAVFLPGFSRKNQHILTQLPLPATVTDFWQMVTQYKVTLLVACQVELMNNDSSIGNYFPLKENEQLSVSHFTIKSLQTISGVLWNKQKLVITKNTGNIQEKEHHLTHLTCKCSPADQKPADWLNFLEILRSFRALGDGRTVYMCRNGAEYSGLVCVLSLLLDRLDNDHRLTVPLVVGAIKAIRPQVIPTVHQYKLMYQVLKLYNDSNNVYSNF